MRSFLFYLRAKWSPRKQLTLSVSKRCHRWFKDRCAGKRKVKVVGGGGVGGGQCWVTGESQSVGTSCSSSDQEIKNDWFDRPLNAFADLLCDVTLTPDLLLLPPQVTDVLEQEGFSRQKRGYRNINDIEVNMSDPLFTKQWYLVSNQPSDRLLAAWPLRPAPAFFRPNYTEAGHILSALVFIR